MITSSNRGSTSANALILMDGVRVTGVDVGGNINGRNFQGNFRSR
jgi:outer membrane receptor for ferrienterochelin and colicin